VSGRTTKRPTQPRRRADELPSFRQRSPIAFWVAVLILLGLVSSVLAGVLAGLAR
jgi:hypothetical protein